VHQIRFRPEFRPGPHWGSLQLSPDPLADLRGLLLRGEGKGEGKLMEGDSTGPPYGNSWIRPLIVPSVTRKKNYPLPSTKLTTGHLPQFSTNGKITPPPRPLRGQPSWKRSPFEKYHPNFLRIGTPVSP